MAEWVLKGSLKGPKGDTGENGADAQFPEGGATGDFLQKKADGTGWFNSEGLLRASYVGTLQQLGDEGQSLEIHDVSVTSNGYVAGVSTDKPPEDGAFVYADDKNSPHLGHNRVGVLNGIPYVDLDTTDTTGENGHLAADGRYNYVDDIEAADAAKEQGEALTIPTGAAVKQYVADHVGDALPEGGTAGQILIKGATGVEWADSIQMGTTAADIALVDSAAIVDDPANPTSGIVLKTDAGTKKTVITGVGDKVVDEIYISDLDTSATGNRAVNKNYVDQAIEGIDIPEAPNLDAFLQVRGGSLQNGAGDDVDSLFIMGDGTTMSLSASQTYSNLTVNGPTGSDKKIRLQSSSSGSTFAMDDKSVIGITDVVGSGTGNALATDKAVKDYVEAHAGDALPEGGTAGQILTKTADGEEWADAPQTLPEGGTDGQVLTSDGAGGAAWESVPQPDLSGYVEKPIGGNANDVLVKSSSGTEWVSGAVTASLEESRTNVDGFETARLSSINGDSIGSIMLANNSSSYAAEMFSNMDGNRSGKMGFGLFGGYTLLSGLYVEDGFAHLVLNQQEIQDIDTEIVSDHASDLCVPTSKAVADYVAANTPDPLPEGDYLFLGDNSGLLKHYVDGSPYNVNRIQLNSISGSGSIDIDTNVSSPNIKLNGTNISEIDVRAVLGDPYVTLTAESDGDAEIATNGKFTMDSKSVTSITDTISTSPSGNALVTDKAVADYVAANAPETDLSGLLKADFTGIEKLDANTVDISTLGPGTYLLSAVAQGSEEYNDTLFPDEMVYGNPDSGTCILNVYGGFSGTGRKHLELFVIKSAGSGSRYYATTDGTGTLLSKDSWQTDKINLNNAVTEDNTNSAVTGKAVADYISSLVATDEEFCTYHGIPQMTS